MQAQKKKMQGLSSKLMPEPTWQRGVGTGEAAEAADQRLTN